MPVINNLTDQLTKNFNISEFRCNDKDRTPVPYKYYDNVKLLAQNLQALRDYLGEPIHINSGYRTPEYNATLEGSAKHSQHMVGKAADITVKSRTPNELYAIIEKLIQEGKMKDGGHGIYNTFNHYDVRDGHSRWDFRK